MDQIEQAGRALGKIFADFMGLKSGGNITNEIAITNQRLQSQLDINIEHLLSLKRRDATEYLQDRVGTDEHVETLSDYLKDIGLFKKKTNDSEFQLYLSKALELLEIADDISRTMSFDRNRKKTEIRDLLTLSLIHISEPTRPY